MSLVNPHGGGPLKPLLLEGEALSAERGRAESLPKVKVSSREKGDIIMLANSPARRLAGAIASSAGRIAGCVKTIAEKAEIAAPQAA